MKKMWLLLAMVVVLTVACSKEGGAENDADVLEIGSLHEVEGVKGVIFELLPGGQGGTMLSLDESDVPLVWQEASLWCRFYSRGWKLPTVEDLTAIYNSKAEINQTLANTEGGMQLKDAEYWSSEEVDDGSYGYEDAAYVDLSDGTTRTDKKAVKREVRAIYRF